MDVLHHMEAEILSKYIMNIDLAFLTVMLPPVLNSQNIFSLHCIPQRIVPDQGCCFKAEMWQWTHVDRIS
jgi:hypothetical protein